MSIHRPQIDLLDEVGICRQVGRHKEEVEEEE